MTTETATVERLEAFHRNTRQALIYAQSLAGMSLSHASMGIPHKSGAARTDEVWNRPLPEVTGENIAAVGFMLAESISKLNADGEAYATLRAVAFANDGSAHQNAYRFVRDVIQTLHVVCGVDWFGERPSDETEWQTIGASMVPVLPLLVRRLKEAHRPDIARLETIMGDELLKAKLQLPRVNRPGYLNIVADDQRRVATRGDLRTDEVPAKLLWPLFKGLWDAGEAGLTTEEFGNLVAACGGELSGRNQAITSLREYLPAINVCIPDVRSMGRYVLAENNLSKS